MWPSQIWEDFNLMAKGKSIVISTLCYKHWSKLSVQSKFAFYPHFLYSSLDLRLGLWLSLGNVKRENSDFLEKQPVPIQNHHWQMFLHIPQLLEKDSVSIGSSVGSTLATWLSRTKSGCRLLPLISQSIFPCKCSQKWHKCFNYVISKSNLSQTSRN